MIEMYRTILGISDGFDAHSGLISWPSAAPSGFARLATAVALVRPLSENQSSLYRVGAQRQKGCANPIRIWPNIASPKMPPFALVPAYLSQFPTSSSAAVVMIAGFGPPLFRIQMTRLVIWLMIAKAWKGCSFHFSVFFLRDFIFTYGLTTQKAKR